ncbi:agglutinin biogenesis protein MshD [Idiomarina tyrosinivorans]|uniref:Agglutinin biogenesis protein MshD n=1 Tax=Idiomarina tyrosinivorans TaxID=1445662 RepID=A0A432ZQB8_9GAMM|nr:type II secretion system protein [Idiomarina tyrosinivorans]RUO80135.1 agglutinin biogenesis protein MshD [Idiomarina tyrosinivorans]
MNSQRGFTLIELIIGIVLLGIAVAGLASLVFSQARPSITPLYQLRASELATALMDEILAMSFDENNLTLAANSRCGSSPCTAPNDLGFEVGESRQNYDDVDDFNDFSINGALLVDEPSLSEIYRNFTLTVEVCYVTEPWNNCRTDIVTMYKRITITVNAADQGNVVVTSIRSNL